MSSVIHWHLPANYVNCPVCGKGCVLVANVEDNEWLWRCSICERSGRAQVETTIEPVPNSSHN
jgi:transcription elongation factor Elf1